MDDLKIKKWLPDPGDGYGSGDGYGYGSGYGDGSGDGYGYGSGYGDGYGDGSGSGYGDGSGDGYGSGYGSGYGYGYGYGDGYGDGIKEFNDMKVYMVDDVQTIITNIKGNLARGFILQGDLSLKPCFIVKGQGYFAHGETVKEARQALQSKIFENMDTDEAIDKFIEKFKKGRKYIAKDFYEWHHFLTGSCEMGRRSFMQDHGITFEDKLTVDEFIELCKNSYGGDIITQLKERWNEI